MHEDMGICNDMSRTLPPLTRGKQSKIYVPNRGATFCPALARTVPHLQLYLRAPPPLPTRTALGQMAPEFPTPLLKAAVCHSPGVEQTWSLRMASTRLSGKRYRRNQQPSGGVWHLARGVS